MLNFDLFSAAPTRLGHPPGRRLALGEAGATCAMKARRDPARPCRSPDDDNLAPQEQLSYRTSASLKSIARARRAHRQPVRYPASARCSTCSNTRTEYFAGPPRASLRATDLDGGRGACCLAAGMGGLHAPGSSLNRAAGQRDRRRRIREQTSEAIGELPPGPTHRVSAARSTRKPSCQKAMRATRLLTDRITRRPLRFAVTRRRPSR